jgi:hypothetical protein
MAIYHISPLAPQLMSIGDNLDENILLELLLNTFISFLLFSVLPDRYWSQAEDQQPKKNHHTPKALVVYRSL